MTFGASTIDSPSLTELYAEAQRYFMGQGKLNNALARLVELVPGPDLKGSNATVPEKEQEEQRATASTQTRQRRENRAGSNRRSATGRVDGRDDARRHASRKGDQ